jgi:hypothetical protein
MRPLTQAARLHSTPTIKKKNVDFAMDLSHFLEPTWELYPNIATSYLYFENDYITHHIAS